LASPSRTHLDLLRRSGPALERRVEVAFQRLELGAERSGLGGAVGSRVERGVLERRDDPCDPGLQLRHACLGHFELLLSAAPLLARVLLGFWRDALML